MTPRRPRIVLGSAVLLLATVLAVFAYGLLDHRAVQRDAAERRFADQAVVTASMIESFFGANPQQGQERNAMLFGGPTVPLPALNERVRRDRATYAIVLEADGHFLASTTGVTPAVRRRLGARPDHVARVLDGRAPYRISGFVEGQTTEYATAFETPDGDRRVLVEGFSAPALSFLAAYFTRLPDADRQRGAVVDARGRTVTATGRAPVEAGGRRVVQAPIGGTEWRAVLSQRAGTLYEDVHTRFEWLGLAALALVGAMVIALLGRAVRRDAALKDAYADLERANAELRRSNAELEQFAAVASHDLQEPLRKVQAFGEQLERRHGDRLPAEGRDHLRRMRRAAERMSVLIDDLLSLSRVTTHAKPPQRVDLTRLAHEVVQDLDARHSVIVDRLPAVDGDPVQLRQLLQNLVANGLKFRRDGVVPLVRLRAARGSAPDRVAFAVSDTGIGFAPADAERIFAVFERLHSRDVFPGTGIGLAVCRRIVERHGGTIAAAGYPGHGAVLTVDLPTVTLPATPTPVREPSLV